MSLQFSTTDRTAFAAQLVAAAASGTLTLFSGAEPANCAASDPSGPLATGTLPNPALAASGGVASMVGTWTATGTASGNAASFRLYDSGAVCRIQGSVTATGGGGDMTLNNVSIASSQAVSIATFQITMGNA